jgi:hypothetical protein
MSPSVGLPEQIPKRKDKPFNCGDALRVAHDPHDEREDGQDRYAS